MTNSELLEELKVLLEDHGATNLYPSIRKLQVAVLILAQHILETN